MKINWFKISGYLARGEVFTLILNSLIHTNYGTYSELIKFLKIGYNCKDCNKPSYKCECDDKIEYLSTKKMIDFIIYFSKMNFSPSIFEGIKSRLSNKLTLNEFKTEHEYIAEKLNIIK